MEKEKFRCHPSIIIEKLAIFFLVIIFLIIYNFDDARMLIEGGMTLKRIVIRIIEITIFLAIFISNFSCSNKYFNPFTIISLSSTNRISLILSLPFYIIHCFY